MNSLLSAISSGTKDAMVKRGGRQVFLGVQWDCGSWENLPPLCDFLLEKVGKRPLAWSFPARLPENPKNSRLWLEKTIGPRADIDLVAGMGFAGACHPVLTLDELEKEVSWGLENPWGSGVVQLTGAHPEILIPRVPDLQRPEASKLYARHGFRILGVPNGRELAWFTEDGLECFTFARIRVAREFGFGQGTRSFRPALPRGGNILLVLDLSGNVTLEDLASAFDRTVAPWLASDGTPSPLKTTHTTSRGIGRLAVDSLDWSPFPDPILRQVVATHAVGLRKKRKKNDEYRELLTGLSLASAPDPQDASRTPLARDGAQLVAQMLGEVALAGNGFDVRLIGGRFTGITKAGRQCLPARPARSYLRVGGKTLQFRTMNSFSFEGDGVIGLREVLGIDSQEASLDIEYSFCEGCSMLEITAEVRWPVLPPGAVVEEHAPLVISIREVERGEEVVIECAAPDGSASSPRIGGHRWTVIPGALYRIALGGGTTLLMRPGPMGATGWGLATFRVAREGRRRFLETNPFGGWSPLQAAVLSGRREKFSLLVGIEDEGTGEGRS